MERSPIIRLSGVYNADGGVVGEARYLLDKLTGRASCALCDITHGLNVRGRRAWRQCRSGFPVPFDVYHRNDQPDHVAAFTTDLLPCVVAHHEDGRLSVAVDASQLAECNHDVAALELLLMKLL